MAGVFLKVLLNSYHSSDTHVKYIYIYIYSSKSHGSESLYEASKCIPGLKFLRGCTGGCGHSCIPKWRGPGTWKPQQECPALLFSIFENQVPTAGLELQHLWHTAASRL